MLFRDQIKILTTTTQATMAIGTFGIKVKSTLQIFPHICWYVCFTVGPAVCNIIHHAQTHPLWSVVTNLFNRKMTDLCGIFCLWHATGQPLLTNRDLCQAICISMYFRCPEARILSMRCHPQIHGQIHTKAMTPTEQQQMLKCSSRS